jgi:hypothetical protein
MAQSRREPVSYSWGSLAPISGANGQDPLAQFDEQFGPTSALFGPNNPPLPGEARRARVLDYPAGYNLLYRPRSYEPISFEELRALAQNYDITRLAIETRKDQIEKLDWEIVPMDADNAPSGTLRQVDAMARFWEKPDGEQPFASWLRESLEDLLVLGADIRGTPQSRWPSDRAGHR